MGIRADRLSISAAKNVSDKYKVCGILWDIMGFPGDAEFYKRVVLESRD